MIRQAYETPHFPGLPAPVRFAVPTRGRTGDSNSGLQHQAVRGRVPQGAELGRYRRTIQPFENWELRCDENLKTKKKDLQYHADNLD